MQLRFILLATLSLLSCFVVSANSKTFNITFDEADFSYKSEERSGYQVGKTWIYSVYKNVQDEDGTVTRVVKTQRSDKIIGDTLYEGKWYAKVNQSYTQTNESGVPVSWDSEFNELYYVDNGKCYRAAVEYNNTICLYTECDREPQLFIDFNAHKGDLLDIIDMTDGVTVHDQYEVTDVTTLPVNGIDRKVMTMRCGSEKFYWIDGIGIHLPNQSFKYGGYLVYSNVTLSGSVSNSENSSFSIECMLGDELLYSWENFERRMQEYEQGIMAIEQISAEREKDTTLYDLMGRRIDGNPAPGIYIRGGKKIVIQ